MPTTAPTSSVLLDQDDEDLLAGIEAAEGPAPSLEELNSSLQEIGDLGDADEWGTF